MLKGIVSEVREECDVDSAVSEQCEVASFENAVVIR
jgi:hypothetical protein